MYLVLGSPEQPRTTQVLLDGRPVGRRDAGGDVRGSAVRVRTQRLYRLVSLRAAGNHTLELRPQPGTRAYVFTFG